MTGRHIADWNAEDVVAWEAGNSAIARRNLICAIAADHVAFSIFALWSVMAMFLGPLLGSLARIPGGVLSDRKGGGRVTPVELAGMACVAVFLITFSVRVDHLRGPMGTADMAGYVVAFLLLFVLAGIGNASVFKMIPSVFAARSRSLDLDETGRRRWLDTHSGALIGLTGAVGAFGGVGINLVLRHSYQSGDTDASRSGARRTGELLAVPAEKIPSCLETRCRVLT